MDPTHIRDYSEAPATPLGFAARPETPQEATAWVLLPFVILATVISAGNIHGRREILRTREDEEERRRRAATAVYREAIWREETTGRDLRYACLSFTNAATRANDYRQVRFATVVDALAIVEDLVWRRLLEADAANRLVAHATLLTIADGSLRTKNDEVMRTQFLDRGSVHSQRVTLPYPQ